MTWQGIHHLAVATRDLEQTIRFYTEVLGMKSNDIYPANPFHGRHAFIKPGETAETWGLHFFESAEAQIHMHPDALRRLTFIPGALQHIAFALPDESAGLQLRQRLESLEIEMT